MQRLGVRRIVLWAVGAATATLMLITSSAAQTKMTSEVNERGAPLFNDLGDHQFAISTNSPEAQKYFNQGLILTYGFNHGEAIRSFQEAIRLDSNCAMCYWGVALALGPNINRPMDAADVPRVWDALQQAKRLAANATEKEKAYINALELRVSGLCSSVKMGWSLNCVHGPQRWSSVRASSQVRSTLPSTINSKNIKLRYPIHSGMFTFVRLF